MTEEIEQQVLATRQVMSDRQLVIARDPIDILKRTRDKAWWDLERECERLDMKFDEAKVEPVWEYRLTLVTEKDPERLKRREVLKEWSEQDNPRLLAPMHNMGKIWLDQNRDLLPGLKKTAGVIGSGRDADRALRGYRGLLLIVQPGDRGYEPSRMWDDFHRQVHEIAQWEHFSTWTEILP